jgi:hypothetical protein
VVTEFGVESDRAKEKPLRLAVALSIEPVHVGQPEVTYPDRPVASP